MKGLLLEAMQKMCLNIKLNSYSVDSSGTVNVWILKVLSLTICQFPEFISHCGVWTRYWWMRSHEGQVNNCQLNILIKWSKSNISFSQPMRPLNLRKLLMWLVKRSGSHCIIARYTGEELLWGEKLLVSSVDETSLASKVLQGGLDINHGMKATKW